MNIYFIYIGLMRTESSKKCMWLLESMGFIITICINFKGQNIDCYIISNARRNAPCSRNFVWPDCIQQSVNIEYLICIHLHTWWGLSHFFFFLQLSTTPKVVYKATLDLEIRSDSRTQSEKIRFCSTLFRYLTPPALKVERESHLVRPEKRKIWKSGRF